MSVCFNGVIPRAQSFIVVISAADHFPLRALVFGVTLRLLRRLPSKTNSVAHQRLMSSTRWSVTAKCIVVRVHSTPWSQVLAENRDFCLPHLQSTPPLRRSPSEYRHDVWYGKTRMVWLPEGENFLKISLFVSTECTNVTDGRTDRHRMTAKAALDVSIARQKGN